MPSTSGCPNARGNEMLSKQVGLINGAIVMTSAFLDITIIPQGTPVAKPITDLLDFFGYLQMFFISAVGHHEAVAIGQMYVIFWTFHFQLLRRKITVKHKTP